MENRSNSSDQLSAFLESGIYRFENSNAVFLDPVRLLNRSYTRFKVSPSAYYSRFFHAEKPSIDDHQETLVPSKSSKKRKRKGQKPPALNDRERAAEQRHQQARPALLKAHESLMKATDLLAIMRNLQNHSSPPPKECENSSSRNGTQQSLAELGRVWQAPLYDITLNFPQHRRPREDGGGCPIDQCGQQRVLPAFNNLVVNETSDDVEADFLNRKYIMPRESCFYMSDLEQIHNLVPAESSYGFNILVIDPPWENASARQKLLYSTLPNRYFLSLPIKQLTHEDGALVALWVTNREKLRTFVEKELFPAWGVTYAACIHWLKVKPDGSLIGDLDLFHHRPYECLLLGYCSCKGTNSESLSSLRHIKDDQVIISIPSDYSRKPPLGGLLLDHVPGRKPARCIELFAREMIAGWISWGNEPLHFQESGYFVRDEMDTIST